MLVLARVETNQQITLFPAAEDGPHLNDIAANEKYNYFFLEVTTEI